MDFPRFQLLERGAAKSCRLKQLVSRGPTLATNSQLLSALVIQRHAAKHLLSPRCIHRPVHTKRVLAHGTHVKVCTYVGKVAVQCARSARHVVYRAPWSMGEWISRIASKLANPRYRTKLLAAQSAKRGNLSFEDHRFTLGQDSRKELDNENLNNAFFRITSATCTLGILFSIKVASFFPRLFPLIFDWRLWLCAATCVYTNRYIRG